MTQCFLPLPCLDAALASEARSTGWGVGMTCGAGGGLGVLFHTTANECQLSHLSKATMLLITCGSGEHLRTGRSQEMLLRCISLVWPVCRSSVFRHQEPLLWWLFSFPPFFFLMLFMGEVQCGVIKQRTLKLRSAYWRQWNSYLPLIKSTLFRKCSWEVVLWSDCLLHFQGNHRASPLLLPSRRSVQCLLMQDHFS